MLSRPYPPGPEDEYEDEAGELPARPEESWRTRGGLAYRARLPAGESLWRWLEKKVRPLHYHSRLPKATHID